MTITTTYRATVCYADSADELRRVALSFTACHRARYTDLIELAADRFCAMAADDSAYLYCEAITAV